MMIKTMNIVLTSPFKAMFKIKIQSQTSGTSHGQNSEFTKSHAYLVKHMHLGLTVRCGFTSALFLSDFTIHFMPFILCWAMLAIPNKLLLESHSEHIHSFGCHSATGVWVHISSVSNKQCNKNDCHFTIRCFKDKYYKLLCTKPHTKVKRLVSDRELTYQIMITNTYTHLVWEVHFSSMIQQNFHYVLVSILASKNKSGVTIL